MCSLAWAMVFGPGSILSEMCGFENLLGASKSCGLMSILKRTSVQRISTRDLWNEMRLPYTTYEIVLIDVLLFGCT
jgi:hypothetical protein